MNSQKGMATLAVVSGILLIVALFAVSVANSGLADVKKTQNQILDAKQRASAKAGLDCAISVFEQIKPEPNDINFKNKLTSDCGMSTDSTIVIKDELDHWKIEARSGYAKSAAIIKSSGDSAAAFKISGSAIFDGGQLWTPAKGDLIQNDAGDDEYQCVAIIAGGDVTISTGPESDAVFHSDLHSVIDGSGPKCADDFSTYVKSENPITNQFEQDILHNQSGLTLFEDLFGRKKEEWPSVAKHFKQFSTGSDEHQVNISDCGSHINKLIPDHDKIWINGSCDLNSLSNPTTNNRPVVVVVRDGVIASNGALAHFNGAVIQFTSELSGFFELWGLEVDTGEGTADSPYTYKCKTGTPFTSICQNMIAFVGNTYDAWDYLPFLFNGAFTTDGRFIVDALGDKSVARIRGSMLPGYDDSMFDPEVFSGEPRLLKGSIHDF